MYDSAMSNCEGNSVSHSIRVQLAASQHDEKAAIFYDLMYLIPEKVLEPFCRALLWHVTEGALPTIEQMAARSRVFAKRIFVATGTAVSLESMYKEFPNEKEIRVYMRMLLHLLVLLDNEDFAVMLYPAFQKHRKW